MNWLGRFYQWLWFHSEWYLTPIDRRPYTFIFRDFIFKHVIVFCVILFIFYAGMIALSIWHGTASTITTTFASFLLAHLVWGTKWIEGQQEYPEYLGVETATEATAKFTKDYYEPDKL